MKHSHVPKVSFAVFASIFLIFCATAFFVQNNSHYDAELRFSEKSGNASILGGMLPASCESGGNDLVGPAHTSACVWTQYCTGANDPNPWQIWEYSNDDTVDYRYTGVNCPPTPSAAINFN